jgi:hypothetical protein
MTQDSMLTKMFFTMKMADHYKKRGTSVKGNNMSQCISKCSYSSYHMIVVIKHGEQRDSCEAAGKYMSPETNIQERNNKNQNLHQFIHQLSCVKFKERMECQFRATSLNPSSGKNLSPA